MSAAELLRFHFAQHDARSLRRMNQLRMERRFCDVTIVAERLRFPGHRVVLAACSPFLRDQFLLNPSREVRVALADRPEMVSRLLLCCYTGSLHFPFTDLVNYLTAASHLQMDQVVQECRRALARYLDPRILIEESADPDQDQDQDQDQDLDQHQVQQQDQDQHHGQRQDPGCRTGPPRLWGGTPATPGEVYVVIEPDSEPSPAELSEDEEDREGVGESSGSAGPYCICPGPPPRAHHHRHFGCPRCAKALGPRVGRVGVKPYRCPTCDKTFTQNRSLKDHMNLHSGERPHRCLYCLACFAHKPALRRHLKEQHGKTTADNCQLARMQMPDGPP